MQFLFFAGQQALLASASPGYIYILIPVLANGSCTSYPSAACSNTACLHPFVDYVCNYCQQKVFRFDLTHLFGGRLQYHDVINHVQWILIYTWGFVFG